MTKPCISVVLAKRVNPEKLAILCCQVRCKKELPTIASLVKEKVQLRTTEYASTSKSHFYLNPQVLIEIIMGPQSVTIKNKELNYCGPATRDTPYSSYFVQQILLDIITFFDCFYYTSPKSHEWTSNTKLCKSTSISTEFLGQIDTL